MFYLTELSLLSNFYISLLYFLWFMFHNSQIDDKNFLQHLSFN